MSKDRIIPFEEFTKSLNEDFYNPFDDNLKEKKPDKVSDFGGAFQQKKESFNLGRVEYSRRPGGDYVMVGKTQFAKGEIVEVCPVIIVSDVVKAIDKLKDIVFELDKAKEQWGMVLGYGSLYRHSPKPNLDYAYNPKNKQMYFITNRYIKLGEELTINYGDDYWKERTSFGTMAQLPDVNQPYQQPVKKENESAVQPNASDRLQQQADGMFNNPMSPQNPAASGVARQGIGQQ